MVSVASQADTKLNTVLKSADIRILLFCDHLARDLLRQALSQGIILLQEDDENDVGRRILVGQILNVITSETSTKQIRREVGLTDIHKCKQEPHQNLSSFANRFLAAVA